MIRAARPSTDWGPARRRPGAPGAAQQRTMDRMSSDDQHPLLELGGPEGAVPEGPVLEVDDRLHAGDLIEDPRLDSEALCLCGLLWSTAAGTRQVVDLLRAGDFIRPMHAALFELLADQLDQGRPHDPASIAAVITHQGTRAHHAGLLGKALADVIGAGATPESVAHHAITVATAGYRRSFHAAATAMTQAAEQLPTAELFAHLLDIGRTQRTATERLHHLHTTLDTSRTP